MISSNRMHIVHVFAQEKYAGNQLAVFHGAESMTTGEMQRLPREMNYSEASFIRSADERDVGTTSESSTPLKNSNLPGIPRSVPRSSFERSSSMIL